MTDEKIKARILAMASCPQGMLKSDLANALKGEPRTIARRMVGDLTRSGELIEVLHPQRVAMSHGGQRYFVSQDTAQAWLQGAANRPANARAKAQRRAIVAYLKGWPQGQRRSEIAGAINASMTTTAVHLAEMALSGEISACGNSRYRLYCLPEHADAVSAQIAAALRETRRRAKQKDAARRKPPVEFRLPVKAASERRYEWPSDAPRRELGPRVPSVWALAELVGGDARGQA